MKKILLSVALISVTGIANANNQNYNRSEIGVISAENLTEHLLNKQTKQQDGKEKKPSSSKVISVSINNNLMDLEKGIPANSQGNIQIHVKNADKLKKNNPNEGFKINLILVRGNKPTQAMLRITLDEAEKGMPFSEVAKEARPGDRILIEVNNTNEIISIPII